MLNDLLMQIFSIKEIAVNTIHALLFQSVIPLLSGGTYEVRRNT